MFSKRSSEGNAGTLDAPLSAEGEAVGPEQPVTAESQVDAETPVADADESTPAWEELGFASAQELADAYRNVNSLRGRLANDVGELRGENEQLRAIIEEGGGDSPAPNVVGLLEELDSRSLAQFESIARRVAEVIEARVGPLEEKVEALIERLVKETAGHA